MMPLAKTPIDRDARIRALSPEQSFICEAPAGSGKTELLTQRVLTLLARVAQPEAVLAITFTRKAAAEMQERVMHALQSALAPAPHDEHKKNTWQLAKAVLQADAQHQWGLLANPARLQIKTFDGLARHLMQSLPLQAGLDPSWQPSDDPEQLYQEAARNLLETFEQRVPWRDALKTLLRHLDNRYDICEGLLVGMLANRDAWMPILGVQQADSEAGLRNLLETFLTITLRDKVETLQQLIPSEQGRQLMALVQFAAANLGSQPDSPLACLYGAEVCELPGSDAQSLTQWRALAGWMLTQKGEFRKRLTKNEGFVKGEGKAEIAAFKQQKEAMAQLLSQWGESPELAEAIVDIQSWPTPAYADEQWPVLEALTQLLPVAVVHLHWVFEQQQQLDFTEISQRARRALGEEEAPTDLMQRLDYAIEHILVDEFQDTSFTQVDLLKKLTYGWQPGDGRTLFCVGDAMQSIYSFRGANVGLFLHCKLKGLGHVALENLQLSANFRSQASVVSWVNKTFDRAFPRRMEISTGAVPYSNAEAFRAAENFGVSTHVFPPDSETASATWMANKMAALWAQNPQTRIGVLVKSRHHAKALVEVLSQRAMRFRAVDMVPLAAREVIQDLLSLTHALLDPSDRIAWLAVLRAPWCGLLLRDLTALVEARGANTTLIEAMAQAVEHPDNTALSDDGRARLTRVVPILKAAMASRARKPLTLWVAGVWHALGGAQLVTEPADEQNIERYWQVLEAVSQQGHAPSKQALERAIAKLYAAPDTLADDRLQIMTIHKSKGLEFDAVFLPQLHRRGKNTDQELLLWQERLSHAGDDTLLLAPIHPLGQSKDPIYQHLLHEKKRRLRLEACRLLYVACTRAREQLFLLAELEAAEGEDTRFSPPSSASLLAYIWPSVELTAHAEAVASHVPEGHPAEAQVFSLPQLKRVPAAWQPPKQERPNPLAAFELSQQYDNTNQVLPIAPDWEGERLRHVGTVVHATAEAIAKRGWQMREATLRELKPTWGKQLQRLGVVPQWRFAAEQAVAKAVTQLLGHPKFEWLLTQPERYFEYPVCLNRAGKLETLVLDVLVVSEDGTAWVVDYKTGVPTDDEPREVFLERETKRYAPALRAYREAVMALGYPSVATALFFVTTGDWQVLDGG